MGVLNGVYVHLEAPQETIAATIVVAVTLSNLSGNFYAVISVLMLSFSSLRLRRQLLSCQLVRTSGVCPMCQQAQCVLYYTHTRLQLYGKRSKTHELSVIKKDQTFMVQIFNLLGDHFIIRTSRDLVDSKSTACCYCLDTE